MISLKKLSTGSVLAERRHAAVGSGAADAQGQGSDCPVQQLLSPSLSVEEIMRLAGVTGFQGRWYGRLSGDQKRRVQFALGICVNPELLILDEPTAALDPLTRNTAERFGRRSRPGTRQDDRVYHPLPGGSGALGRPEHHLASRKSARGRIGHRDQGAGEGKCIRFHSRFGTEPFLRLLGVLQAEKVGIKHRKS